jgi:hypothetical protein
VAPFLAPFSMKHLPTSAVFVQESVESTSIRCNPAKVKLRIQLLIASVTCATLRAKTEAVESRHGSLRPTGWRAGIRCAHRWSRRRSPAGDRRADRIPR